MQRIIWQYWETRGEKPRFVDGLLELTRANSGAEVVQVTPETLNTYVPDIPARLFEINELAHKADMIRTLLLREHGGMWLDSDAIVLGDLTWLFDLLDEHEFVGFNDSGRISRRDTEVRINCFLTRRGSSIVSEWARQQHAKFPRTTYQWTEIGTKILGPICLKHRKQVRILPFRMVSPVPWDRVEEFSSTSVDAERLLDGVHIVMLSNKQLARHNPDIQRQTVEEMAARQDLLGAIVRKALAVERPA